jgi:hypothetical protein
MSTLARYVDFPDYPTGAHPVIYVSTDRDARERGCAWGLLIGKRDECMWVLTNRGIRYYGIEAEHDFVTRDDPRWEAVHGTWMLGLETMASQQGHLSAAALPCR